MGTEATAEASRASRHRNRYTNVVAYDHTRVVLKVLEGDERCDYINANRICMPRGTYIACQGPLSGTTEDFWRMLWQQNTRVIIMVTNEREGGRVKCARYWPEQAGSTVTESEQPRMELGYYSVVLQQTESLPGMTRRVLTLERYGEEPREIVQLHFEAWPDHGVPADPRDILQFRQTAYYETQRLAKVARSEPIGPTVVHCSAGVGRSGTYIAIDSALLQLEVCLCSRHL